MSPAPPLKPRPRLYAWLRDRGLGVADLGRRWQITPQGASRYLLPFSNPKRAIPDEERMADALAWTDGEIGVSGWYPAELSAAHAAPAPDAATASGPVS